MPEGQSLLSTAAGRAVAGVCVCVCVHQVIQTLIERRTNLETLRQELTNSNTRRGLDPGRREERKSNRVVKNQGGRREGVAKESRHMSYSTASHSSNRIQFTIQKKNRTMHIQEDWRLLDTMRLRTRKGTPGFDQKVYTHTHTLILRFHINNKAYMRV